jgi:uncharacterized protein YkwD
VHRPVQLFATTLACAALTASSALVTPASVLASGPAASTARAHARSHSRRARRVRHTTCRSSGRTKPQSAGSGCKATVRKLRTEQHPKKARPVAPAPERTVTEVSAAPTNGNSPQAAAAVAAALAAPCANTELAPEAANLELVRAAVLCLVNRERAQHGESPLRLSSRLEGAAAGHCSELIADDYFAHVSPSGETPVQRIRATGYIPGPSVGYVLGENLAWGTYGLATPQAIVAAWIASPGHLANILEAKYTETGIGISAAVPPSLANGAPGATYAQEFGVIIH